MAATPDAPPSWKRTRRSATGRPSGTEEPAAHPVDQASFPSVAGEGTALGIRSSGVGSFWPQLIRGRHANSLDGPSHLTSEADSDWTTIGDGCRLVAGGWLRWHLIFASGVTNGTTGQRHQRLTDSVWPVATGSN